MDPIRLMIAQVPPMLRDIIRAAIAPDRTIQIIPPSAVRPPPGDEPDVIVVGTHRIEATQEAERWLTEWPRARILCVETHDGIWVLWELRPHSTRLGELSPQQMAATIRSAVRPDLE